MRSSGVHGLLIHCADYQCSHSIAMSGDRLPDDLRLSDIEDRLTFFFSSPARPRGRWCF
jgi:hypothetical protein